MFFIPSRELVSRSDIAGKRPKIGTIAQHYLVSKTVPGILMIDPLPIFLMLSKKSLDVVNMNCLLVEPLLENETQIQILLAQAPFCWPRIPLDVSKRKDV